MKALTAQQMREVDRLTTERFAIPGLQLMENAGEAVAEYLARVIPDLQSKTIVVLCGKGNNGGDGFVVARRLKEAGVSPQVFLFADPSSVRGDAATNLKTWQQTCDLRVVNTLSDWESLRDDIAGSD